MPRFERRNPNNDNVVSLDAYRADKHEDDSTAELRSPAIAHMDHFLEVCDHPENWTYGGKDVYIEATLSLAEATRALTGQPLTPDNPLSTEEIEAASDLLANYNFTPGPTSEERTQQCTTLAKDILPRLVASDDITASIDDRVTLIDAFSQRLHSSWQDVWHSTQGRTVEQRPAAPVTEKEVRKDMYGWIKDYWKEHPMRSFTPDQRINNIRTIKALRQTHVMPAMSLALMQTFSIDRYI